MARKIIAAAALATVAMLIAGGLGGRVYVYPHRDNPRGGDLGLYARAIDNVRAGRPFDQSVMADIRVDGGPLKPFTTVRPPLLAEALARLPDAQARRLAAELLAGGVLVAWFLRLSAAPGLRPRRWPLVVALGSGVAMALAPSAYLMHEVWAGLLIALALALRTPERWWLSVFVGTLAALLRELAAPFLAAMAAMAFLERRPKEGAAWLAGLVVFAIALAGHAAAVQALVQPSDTASSGWLKFGGWPFVLHAASWNLVGLLLPPQAIGCAFPLALLGLGAWADALGRRVALVVAGYVSAFLFVGRSGDFYWGLLIAPLWPMGLVQAPRALAWIWRMLSAGLGVREPTRARARTSTAASGS